MGSRVAPERCGAGTGAPGRGWPRSVGGVGGIQVRHLQQPWLRQPQWRARCRAGGRRLPMVGAVVDRRATDLQGGSSRRRQARVCFGRHEAVSTREWGAAAQAGARSKLRRRGGVMEFRRRAQIHSPFRWLNVPSAGSLDLIDGCYGVTGARASQRRNIAGGPALGGALMNAAVPAPHLCSLVRPARSVGFSLWRARPGRATRVGRPLPVARRP